MRVLHDKELAEAVLGMFEGSDRLRCAVAFWGPRMAALAEKRSAEVVLDLSMRCTSKNALAAFGVGKRMKASLGTRLRVLDGLHAKIYLNESSAIVGSPNASGHALGDGQTAPKLRETAVLIERALEPHLYQQVEAIWNEYNKASRPIEPADLDRAPALPATTVARDEPPLATPVAASILAEVVRRPEAFAATVFIFADEPMGREELGAGTLAYEEKLGSSARSDGRSHVCQLSDDPLLDETLRVCRRVITYWFGKDEGLYVYEDLVRIDHDGTVTYFGRRNWPNARRSLSLAARSQEAAFEADRVQAVKLSKTNGQRRGSRFAALSHAELYEALECER